MKKAFKDKSVELKAFVLTDNAKLQAAYYQGQYDCIAFLKPEVQRNLQDYFFKG